MEQKELVEAARELRNQCDSFAYGKDDYCLQLLRYRFGAAAGISEIKQSEFSRLLNKPVMKALSARHGGGRISLAEAAATGAERYEFRISYTLWEGYSRWCQVSRMGWQLVLQLNFPGEHDEAYRQKVQPTGMGPFAYGSHPVRRSRLNTLAWARIDLDSCCGEALIEEVQTDWLREAAELLRECRSTKSRARQRRWLQCSNGAKGDLHNIAEYALNDLQPFRQLWQEALLSACIWLLVEQLGYRRVYMHSYETGSELKNCSPPRSLYSRLPRKFCLRPVRYGPGMVTREPKARQAMRRVENPFWYYQRFQHDHNGGSDHASA